MQYSFKKALKLHSGRAEAAVGKDLEQLHRRDTFPPQDTIKLTPQQKKMALESLIRREGIIIMEEKYLTLSLHQLIPRAPQDVLLSGPSYITALVPGGAIRCAFQSYLWMCSWW